MGQTERDEANSKSVLLRKELQSLHTTFEASKHDMLMQIAKLTASLEAAQKELLVLQARIQVYEEEAKAKKPMRLALVTEIWACHKQMSDGRKPLYAVMKMHAPKVQGPIKDKLIKDLGESFGHIVKACEHSKLVVSKYFTIDEKLHLGIPSDEGGHHSPTKDLV